MGFKRRAELPLMFSSNTSGVSGVVTGQQAYTTAGTYSWVAPAGVTSVSVVAVGGGGNGYSGAYTGAGGGGGGLGYKIVLLLLRVVHIL